jgi:hypothetical protein
VPADHFVGAQIQDNVGGVMRVSEMSTYELLCLMARKSPRDGVDPMWELAHRIDEFRESQKAAAEDAEAQRREKELLSNLQDTENRKKS